MDKRYDQFTAGVFNAANIILQADPITGALSKIPLSDIAGGSPPNMLTKSVMINANNNGSNPQNFGSMIIPANTMNEIGDWIETEVIYKTITNSGNKEITLRIGGTDIAQMNQTASGMCKIQSWLVKTSGTELTFFFQGIRDLLFQIVQGSSEITVDFTNDITIDLKGIQGIADDYKMIYASMKIYLTTS